MGTMIAFARIVGMVVTHKAFLGSFLKSLAPIAPISVAREQNITAQITHPVRMLESRHPR